jgi:hypothetical protein
MTTIEITHQIEKTKHRLRVKDANKLTSSEVDRIKKKLSVYALFINGKYSE